LTGWVDSCSKLLPLSLLAPPRGRARTYPIRFWQTITLWRHTGAVAGPCPAGEPSPGVTESTEEQVASFLLSKGIKLDCDSVEACHPLPRRSNDDRQ
ncbi:hypothetical protein XENORESO_022226, partial [Xenotaenia resolanae]